MFELRLKSNIIESELEKFWEGERPEKAMGIAN
jgi:hypothetical protein